MYRLRTAGLSKKNQIGRWALPDRVFFACGACHILAHAFLERYGCDSKRVVWIKPAVGFIGNHIIVEWDRWVFDYHGCSGRIAFLDHTWKRARRQWPGWDATLVEIPREALVSEARSREFEGLHLREPGQFPHDALRRAPRFLDRITSCNVGTSVSANTAGRCAALRGR